MIMNCFSRADGMPISAPRRVVPTVFSNYLAIGVMLACVSSEVLSQPDRVRFLHLGSDMGLSQSNVQCIAQDSIGFLWFGTEDGLNRYDGYRCTVYRHDPADSSSISDSYIWSFLKSRTGDLWIGTLNGGLNRYEMSTGKFVRYQRDPNDSTSLSNDNVTGLFEDRDGTPGSAHGAAACADLIAAPGHSSATGMMPLTRTV